MNMNKWFAQLEQSHMPYMVHGPGGAIIFYCVKNDLGAWKLHMARPPIEDAIRVENDLPDDWNECCPVAEYDEGRWAVSFVAGPCRGPGKNGLYRLPDMGVGMTERLVDADVGFARQGWLVHAGRRGPLVVKHGSAATELSLSGLDFLYRVCPDAFSPGILLITASIRGVDQSILYDVHQRRCEIVTCQDACLYKFAAHPAGGYVYALRGLGDHEDRTIVQAGSVVMTPAPGLIQAMPLKAEADSMNCLACFRKHIAAALSFAKEIASGHGAGAGLDHRPDMEGEISNAEHHAMEMTVPGYASALRDLRHKLDGQRWLPEPDDVMMLRKLWKSSMGVSCGCAKHREGTGR